MADRLRPLWDFYDLDATEQRLCLRLENEPDGAGRAVSTPRLGREL